jgi:hypothetical protein
MGAVTRIFTANLALGLVAAWTVPLCCLSMDQSPAHVHANSVVTMAMPGHQHHHHHASESDQSSQRLTASDSCTQACQAAGGVRVMSLPAKTGLGTFQQANAVVTAPLLAVSLSRFSLVNPASGPPGIPLAPALHSAPLRI